MTDQVEKKMYRSKIYKQIRYGCVSFKKKLKEKNLGTLETDYLVEIDKVVSVYEEHGKKKYTHKCDNVPLFAINKYYKRQECVGECG